MAGQRLLTRRPSEAVKHAWRRTDTSFQAFRFPVAPCASCRRAAIATGRIVRARGLFGLLRGQGPAPVTDCPEAPALWSWLREHGLYDQRLQLKSVEPGGRGLVLEERLNKGESALQVPGTALFTAERALEATALGRALSDASIPTWTVLATVLAQLRYTSAALSLCTGSAPLTDAQAHIRQHGGGPLSDNVCLLLPEGSDEQAEIEARAGLRSGAHTEWSPYVDMLPAKTGCILEWDGTCVDSLKRTSAAGHGEEVLSAAAASWAELAPLIDDAVAQETLLPGVVTEASFRWGLSMLLTRLVRLGGPGDAEFEALVPWADFVNHAPSCTTFLTWDSVARAVTLAADRDYAPGDELLASYGEKGSAELLISYGFVPRPGTNRADAYYLRLGVQDDDPHAAEKGRLLGRHGLSAVQAYPIRWGGWPARMMPYAAFVACRPTDALDLEPLAAMLFEDGVMPRLDDEDLASVAARHVAAELEAGRDTLAQSADLDEALAKRLSGGAVTGDEFVFAALASVRVWELRILRRTLRQLKAFHRSVA